MAMQQQAATAHAVKRGTIVFGAVGLLATAAILTGAGFYVNYMGQQRLKAKAQAFFFDKVRLGKVIGDQGSGATVEVYVTVHNKDSHSMSLIDNDFTLVEGNLNGKQWTSDGKTVTVPARSRILSGWIALRNCSMSLLVLRSPKHITLLLT